MSFNRWYPTATSMADRTVLVNSGVEYFEMPVIGGESPQDSTGPFRSLRSLGLSRFPYWPVEPLNLDNPGTLLPRLRNHTSIATGQQQKRADGRGLIVTFGGIDETGQPTNKTWQTWDVAVDPHNSWQTELMPLTTGTPPLAARSEHAASIQEVATGLGSYELRMFVYGGLDANGNALEDVWLLTKPDNSTAATWQQITPSILSADKAPGPRYGHTMVFDPGVAPGAVQGFPPIGGLPRLRYPKMYVFGGKRSTQVWASTDTVWVLELWGSYAWHPLVLSGSKPAPRYRHAAVFDRIQLPGQSTMRMSVFGGAGANPGLNASLLNDTWTLARANNDTLYASWTWTNESAGTVAAVYKHSMIMDEQWNRLLVFGGDRSSESASGETNTGGETNEAFSRSMDVFVSDHTWKARPTTAPVVRKSGHAAVYYALKAVNARVPERFDPRAAYGQKWSSLSASPKFDRETFPFLFAMPDGRLFYAGRGDSSKALAATPTGLWADEQLAGPSSSSLVGEGGSAVQYAPGKIIKVGSNGSAAIATIATFTGSSYSWASASNIGLLARGNLNATMLPGGQVLVTGGRKWADGEDGSNLATPVKTPQIWSPPSNAWTTGAAALADEPAARGYHSTAIILPDARVLSAGGNPKVPGGVDDDYYYGTIFEPPYLFDPGTSGGNGYATRPTIDSAPRWIGHDCPFQLSVTSSSGVSSVCLIRSGAATHAFNEDQVYVPLEFTQSGSDLTVDGPAGPYVAPPGDYLLFVLDNTSQKVPSVARWVRVAEAIWPYQAADVTRPARTLSLNGANGLSGGECTRPVRVTWNAPCDDSSAASSGRVRLLDLRYSTSSICDNCWSAFASATQVECEPPAAMPGETQAKDVSGLDIGSYQFRMVSRDDGSASGNTSGMSNAKTLFVFGCEDGFYAGGEEGGGSGFSARAAWTASLGGGTSGGFSENSLLPPTAGDPINDVLRLANPRIEGDRVHVRLRRGATGETHVLAARLVAVDRPSTSEAFHLESEWRLAERLPVAAASGAHGEDIASLLIGDQSSCLVGDTGDTVSITLPESASGSMSSLYVDAQSGRIADSSDPGLRVLEPDGSGAWREVSRLRPRARFSTLVASGITGNEVRLVFSGNHAVTAVGRLVPGEAPATTPLTAVSVSHSRLGDLDPAGLTEGGTGVVLLPRDTVNLAFKLPATAPADSRDWFLELTGTSTAGSVSASRAGPSQSELMLPVTLHLDAPSPNPFSRGTKFRLGLPKSAMVQFEVYDLAGRRVATVAHERMSAGWHDLMWNGLSRTGGQVAAGIYVCRLLTEGRAMERKVVHVP